VFALALPARERLLKRPRPERERQLLEWDRAPRVEQAAPPEQERAPRARAAQGLEAPEPEDPERRCWFAFLRQALLDLI